MASKARDPRIHRLREIETEEVSLVDRAANKRKFAVIKREDDQMSKAKAPTAMFEDLNRAQVVKMVIPPELKATVLEGATAALEQLTALVSSVNDADEGGDEGAGLPADWAKEFSAIGQLLLGIVEKYPAKAAGDAAPAATGDSGAVVNDPAKSDAAKAAAVPAAKSDDKPADVGATPAAAATGDTPPDAAAAPAADAATTPAADPAPAPAADAAPADAAAAAPAADASVVADPAADPAKTETEKKVPPATELTTGFADSLIAIAARLKAMAAAGGGDELAGLVKDMNGLLGSCPGPDEAATTFAGLLNHLVTKNAGALAPALVEVAERVLVLADAVKKADKPGDKEMKELGSIHALLKSIAEKQAPVAVAPAAAPVAAPSPPGLTADDVKKLVDAGIAAATTPLKAELETLRTEKAALAKKLGEPAANRVSSPESAPSTADVSEVLFPLNYNDPIYRENLKKRGIDF